jgi:hypothetical protein
MKLSPLDIGHVCGAEYTEPSTVDLTAINDQSEFYCQ